MKLSPYHVAFKAMGSPCQLQVYVTDVVDADRLIEPVISEVRRLEARYSRFTTDSLTTEINNSAGDLAGVPIDDETARLLDYADTCYQQSDGLFDITSGILRHVWDFGANRLPEPEQVDAQLDKVGWEHVERHEGHIVLPLAGMEIDFGGMVKEYAADAAAVKATELGIEHGMIDLGGDIRIIGPHPNGDAWHIGIRDPNRTDTSMATIALISGGLASSGDYERCMVIDGVRYGHILNPRTGWPVDGLTAVSVAGDHCLVAGSAATITMLKGEEGDAWLGALGLPGIMMTRDGQLIRTGDQQQENLHNTFYPAA